MFPDLRTYMGFLQQGLNCLAFCRISIYVFIASEFQGNTLSGVFFLNIWLPHGHVWAILEGTASLTRC